MLPKLNDIKKLLFSFLPIILILIGVETGFRFSPHKDTNPTISGFVEPDYDLIWRLRRRTKGPVATNELGLRDTAYHADASVKILLLGDSVSWGNGIPDTKKCFPYLLEKGLSAFGRPRTFEVVNSGVPGYSTFQELKYLELFGLKLKPDMVILQFCLNDVFERYLVLAEHGGDNIFLGIDTRKAVSGIYGFFLDHSRAFEALVRWLQNRSRRREEYHVVKMARDHLSRELTEAWEVTLGEIEQIRGICHRQNIPLLLVIPPYRFQLKDPANLRQPQDHLIKYARAKRIPYVDLLPPFVSGSTGAGIPLFNDSSHFSEFGHKVAAQALVKPVLDTVAIFLKKNP